MNQKMALMVVGGVALIGVVAYLVLTAAPPVPPPEYSAKIVSVEVS